MKLIVGLGNPGNEYTNTRHNMGFMVIDKILDELNIKLTKNKHKGTFVQTKIKGNDVLLTIEKELGVEIVGESKVKIAILDKSICPSLSFGQLSDLINFSISAITKLDSCFISEKPCSFIFWFLELISVFFASNLLQIP